MTIPPLALLLLGAACVLFGVVRPRAALTLPLLLHSSYLMRSSVAGFPTTALEVILLSVLAGTIVSFFPRRWEELRERRRAALDVWSRNRLLVVSVVLFVLAATFSAALAPHPRTAWGTWKAMVVEPILYGATLAAVFRRPQDRVFIVSALIAGGVISLGASLATGGFGENFGRFRGIYDVPNSLALVAAPLLVLCSVMGAFAPLSRVRNVARACVVPLALALLATQSVAGLLAVVLALLGTALVLHFPGRQWLLSLLLLSVTGALWQAASGKLAHTLSPFSSSTLARQQIWRVSVDLVREHPLLGVGLGTFEPAYQEKLRELLGSGWQNAGNSVPFLLPTPRSLHPLEWVVRDPHNIVLSFWLHTGLLGLAAMGVLVVLSIRSWYDAVRLWRRGERSTTVATALALGAAFLSLLVLGIADVPYWKNDLALLWWVYVWFLALSMDARFRSRAVAEGAG